MPRRYFNDGMELTFEDFRAISSAMQREIYDRMMREIVLRKQDAFFGTSFLVQYSTSTSVAVSPGLGLRYDSSQVSPEPNYRPIYLPAQVIKSISAPHGSLPRIDIVVTKDIIEDELSDTRKYKDPGTGTVTNETFVLQRDWGNETVVVAGTPNASPVAPATPAGYIKIATLAVAAVTGMSGAGDVTDNRTKMPVGGDMFIDTTGKVRVPAAAETTIKAIVDSVDAYLKNGHQEYTDFDDLGADPAAPGASKQRVYFKSGSAFYRTPGGVVTPLGGGAGGGGGLIWNPTAGFAPIATEENGELVYLFDPAFGQKLTVWLKVPQGYLAGRQIFMYLAAYSPTATLDWLLQTTATLIRKNVDAVTSVVNQRVSTNAFVTNAVANRYREIIADLSSATGQINSVGITPGDLIKVELSRVTSGGSEDTADVRFVPAATEVKFL